jgi:hypothetical protein
LPQAPLPALLLVTAGEANTTRRVAWTTWPSLDAVPEGNFRVEDLDAMVAQLRDAAIDVKVDAEVYPNGRFAQLADPEGNAIQLWEPA